MVDYLFDVGPVMGGGMSAAAITWEEINEWQDATGIELSAWEARTLRRLSVAFVAATQAAEEPDCKPPYADPAAQRFLHAAELEQKLDTFLN